MASWFFNDFFHLTDLFSDFAGDFFATILFKQPQYKRRRFGASNGSIVLSERGRKHLVLFCRRKWRANCGRSLRSSERQDS
jgi:hypothetical protein